MKNMMGKGLGVILFVGAVAAIWLWPEASVDMSADDTIRPVRSVVVEAGRKMPDIYLAGKIKATKDRTLKFKQSGRLQGLPVAAGKVIKKGEKLAWLDPLDFEKDLAKAQAAEKRDRLTFERKSEAAKKNAISKEEVSRAEADLHQSEAQLAVARRALEDTVLLAPFDGTVAEVPATELDMVSPVTPIVLVHDLSRVKIDVVFPEVLAINAKKFAAKNDSSICHIARASFDSVPGRQFPVKFVEYVSNADARTQTYLATYEMDTPSDLMLMPGMSATLFISGDSYQLTDEDQSKVISLPESAVGVNSDGSHFVWVLEPSNDKAIYLARHRVVKLCCRHNGVVVIDSGVVSGERVATAGVMELTEGRKVRLLAE